MNRYLLLDTLSRILNKRINDDRHSFKDDVQLESTDRLKIVSEQSATGFFELMIAGVTPEDAGRYRCNALNRFGEIKCEANVTVTSKFYNSSLYNSFFKIRFLCYILVYFSLHFKFGQ